MSKYNDKTKLGELLKDQRAVEIVEQVFGKGVLKSPVIMLAKDYTLGVAMKYYGIAGISEEKANELYRKVLALE